MGSQKLSLEQRLQGTKIPLLKKLFKIMIDKKTNLCVAANFDTIDEIRYFVEKCHQHFCILKIQHEAFYNFAEELYHLKRKYNFLVFFDPKWNDHSETIRKVYKYYGQYVDLVTVMPTFSDPFVGIRQALSENLTQLPDDEPRGCLAVCETSFIPAVPQYPDGPQLLRSAESHPDVCCGIIAQQLQVSDPLSMVKMTPGVHLSETKAKSGTQSWRTPAKIMETGTDIIIVGRGICGAPRDQLEAKCIAYKEACNLKT